MLSTTGRTDTLVRVKPLSGNYPKNIGCTQILLVEDNEINIRVAKLLLLDCGFTDIVIARNGQEALSLFSHTIDLVLLDIGLPDINGITVCREMRRLLNGKPLPIIAYTATGDLVQQECAEAGINEVLLKPARLKEFKSVILRHLKWAFNHNRRKQIRSVL